MLQWYRNNPWKLALAAVVFADAMGLLEYATPNSHVSIAALAFATLAVVMQLRLAGTSR